MWPGRSYRFARRAKPVAFASSEHRHGSAAGGPPARGAFSFTEILVGLILLMLAVIPLYSLLISAFSGTATSVMQMRAFGLARSVVELVEALKWEDLTTTSLDAIAAAVPGPDDRGFVLKARLEPEKLVPLVGVPGRQMRTRQVVVEVNFTPGLSEGKRRETTHLALSTIRTRLQ